MALDAQHDFLFEVQEDNHVCVAWLELQAHRLVSLAGVAWPDDSSALTILPAHHLTKSLIGLSAVHSVHISQQHVLIRPPLLHSECFIFELIIECGGLASLDLFQCIRVEKSDKCLETLVGWLLLEVGGARRLD